ncbi:MFS transporter [Kitasatospora sp. NPDC002040]|uniref:MFS transporter n=1 Tax=Kitasatospora sp. NPDC002040 TaxID=3154661 RepID=UPI00331D1702
MNLRLAVTALSPLLPVIRDELHLGTEAVGLFGALPLAMFAVIGLATPSVMRAIGAEATAALAMLVTAVGEAARAFATSGAALVALTVVALAGMALGNVCVPPLIKKHFPNRVAALSTVQLVAVHLGALVPPLVAVPLAGAAGWRASLGSWAVAAALACCLWTWVWARTRRTAKPPVALKALPAPGAAVATRPVWRARTAWNLALLYGMVSWNVFTLFTWLPTLLTEAGQSPALSAAMVSLVVTISLASAVVTPVLTVRIRSTLPLSAGAAAAFVLGYTGLALAPAAAPIAWTLLLGLGCALFPVTITMISTHARTPHGASSLSGFVQGVGCALALLGPLLFGAVHALTGHWSASYLLITAPSVALVAVAGWRVRHARAVEEDLLPALTLAT